MEKETRTIEFYPTTSYKDVMNELKTLTNWTIIHLMIIGENPDGYKLRRNFKRKKYVDWFKSEIHSFDNEKEYEEYKKEYEEYKKAEENKPKRKIRETKKTYSISLERLLKKDPNVVLEKLEKGVLWSYFPNGTFIINDDGGVELDLKKVDEIINKLKKINHIFNIQISYIDDNFVQTEIAAEELKKILNKKRYKLPNLVSVWVFSH